MTATEAPSTRLVASPESCFWGYFEGIPADTRTPGVHIMTGPIAVADARPGDALVVEILDMWPRLRHGANCAAHWGALYEDFGKERITIYELDSRAGEPGFPPTATPVFGFDFTERELYDQPGVISPVERNPREPFGVDVAVPVKPHLGVIGVAPPGSQRFERDAAPRLRCSSTAGPSTLTVSAPTSMPPCSPLLARCSASCRPDSGSRRTRPTGWHRSPSTSGSPRWSMASCHASIDPAMFDR